MARYLTVTCTGPRCKQEGRAKIHGDHVNDLPKGWLLVSSSYLGNPMEFCGHACLQRWSQQMQQAHERQRAWRDGSGSE